MSFMDGHLPKHNSLPRQIADFILREISNGRWTHRLPSERHLCELLDTSRQSIRPALQQLERDGIIKVIGKRRVVVGTPLPSIPDVGKIVPGSKRLVFVSSVIRSDLLHLLLVVVLGQLQEMLGKRGYSMSLQVSPRFSNVGKGADLDKLVKLDPATCYLLGGLPKAGHRWFVENDIPAIVLGSCEPDITLPSIDIDYELLCFHAASQLCARGRKKIALIRHAGDLVGDKRSEDGIVRACKNTRSKVVIHRLPGKGNTAIDWLKSLQQAGTLPDAIIVAAPDIYLSVQCYCAQAGIRIPEDIALVSRNDHPLMDSILPKPCRYSVSSKVYLNSLWRLILPFLEGKRPKVASKLIMPDYIAGDSM